jgi:hypothetical protein
MNVSLSAGLLVCSTRSAIARAARMSLHSHEFTPLGTSHSSLGAAVTVSSAVNASMNSATKSGRMRRRQESWSQMSATECCRGLSTCLGPEPQSVTGSRGRSLRTGRMPHEIRPRSGTRRLNRFAVAWACRRAFSYPTHASVAPQVERPSAVVAASDERRRRRGVHFAAKALDMAVRSGAMRAAAIGRAAGDRAQAC